VNRPATSLDVEPLVPAARPRPVQRAGHIGYHDNRFCGHGVFGDLHASVRDPIDLMLLAFGVRVADHDLEVVRCMALALCSPDARVWPLKLTRTLSSYGSPIAGFFGAQLANGSERMGPGTASGAAASLAWLAAQVGDAPPADDGDAALADAVGRHLVERGRIMGFGVPFRAEDERLLALRRMLAGHPATRRPAWRMFERLERVMRAREGLPPNIVIALAALLVDLGLAPHRAGMFFGMIMAPTFAAHALEAADHDGPLLQELPADALEYRGAGARRSPAEAARVAVGGSAPARRTLAW
jgi:hypothetical protein